MTTKKDNRNRNWWFILYPDSMPENWKEKLEDLHVPIAVSPLHDKDLNPTGECKKPHYHVILTFKGNKSYEQIKEITDSFNSPKPESIIDIGGTVRYLIHRDNPEKYQYEERDIMCLNGFNIDNAFKPTDSQRFQYINEMCEWVDSTGTTEFSKLLDEARIEHFDTWFKVLCMNSTIVMQTYISSKRNYKKDKRKEEIKKMIDLKYDIETGELCE